MADPTNRIRNNQAILQDWKTVAIHDPANETYTLAYTLPYPIRITQIRAQTDTGTCTVALKNGVDAIGTISVTSASIGTAATIDTDHDYLGTTDVLTLQVSSVASSPTLLEVIYNFEWVVES